MLTILFIETKFGWTSLQLVHLTYRVIGLRRRIEKVEGAVTDLKEVLEILGGRNEIGDVFEVGFY